MKRTFQSGAESLVGKIVKLSAFGGVAFFLWTVAENVSRF